MGRHDPDVQAIRGRKGALIRRPCPHCGVLMRPASIPQHLGARRNTTPERFWSYVDKSGDCWLWTGRKDKDGYGIVWWDGKRRRAARVALTVSGQPPPDGLEVCHRCDNPPCVRPDHLFLGTSAANTADKMAKGRFRAGGKPMPGSANGYAKLTEPHVIEIKGWLTAGVKPADIAPRFGVSVPTIYAIRRGTNWSQVIA